MNTITIRISGDGVESFGGTVDFKTYEYFEDNSIDLEEYTQDVESGDESIDIPEEHNFVSYGLDEIDNLWHINGAYLGIEDNKIEVLGSDKSHIWKCSLDTESLEGQGIRLVTEGDFDEIVNKLSKQTAVMVGRKFAGGVIFEVEIEVPKEFDPTKLVIYLHEDDGQDVIKRIEYDDEVIGDESSSSYGQGQEFSWFIS